MKRGILLLGLLALAGATMISGTNAASTNLLAAVTPAGYLYSEPGDSEDGCVRCMRTVGWKGHWHLENCIGVADAAEGTGTPTITGVGWISSKHATSMDAVSNSNSYCAYCHAPGYAKVTTDPTKAKAIKKNKPGMSCIGCHSTHHVAGIQGTRFANYLPGSDIEDEDSYKPRKVAEGSKAANLQCLWCHGKYHGFTKEGFGPAHEAKVKKGDLHCIDCHMGVFNTASTGLEERFHNMKVTANGKYSCNKCHTTWKDKDVKKNVPKIYRAHTAKGHTFPKF